MRDLNEQNITDVVLKTIENTKDPRTREIMTALIRHLHDFVREVNLTTDEWIAAMGFLYRTGRISTPERQEFILLSDLLGVSSLVDILNNHRATDTVTDTSNLGPFYTPDSPMLENGGDLIGDNEGEPMVMSGRVVDQDGAPVAGALLDIWQTAANGLYSNADPDQSDHNLRGRMLTDGDGRYAFTTVKPVSYKVPEDGPGGEMLEAVGRHPWRPAHIHVIVRADGYRPLTTEIFVEDDRYIDEDAVFGVRGTLAVAFRRNDSAKAAAEHRVKAPFYEVTYDFGLQPAG